MENAKQPLKDPAELPPMLANAIQSSALIRRADEIAAAAHAGQSRNDRVTPYIDHPRGVAEWFLDYAKRREFTVEKTEEGVCAALLHDVVEDTNLNAAALKQSFPQPRVLELVDLLTKADPSTSAPASYYDRIAAEPLAVALKGCDRISNLYDASVLEDTPENRAFWRKYARKTAASVEPLVRSDSILGPELSRALYALRARIATTDPWCLVVQYGGFLGVTFHLRNNTDSPLERVRSKAGGWMTLGDELVQTEPTFKTLGDVPARGSLEIAMDESGGYIRFDLEFRHEGRDLEASFAVEPDQWYFSKYDLGDLSGLVLPAKERVE
ncbi:MAG: HD domain-containing protein [Candidatus Eremiobacteraeota bacterium]|nr:HD domain-containing protein [Candidatus Eremiobacteraeota bacterium]